MVGQFTNRNGTHTRIVSQKCVTCCPARLRVRTGSTGVGGGSPSQRNQLPGCALVLRTSPMDLWALTWGVGYQFLDAERIDFRFGSRMVARTALSGEIRSITKTLLDHRARTDRTCLPNGSTMWDLGVDGYGEVVSRIESRARIRARPPDSVRDAGACTHARSARSH
ncbi:DUF6119 family protein [Nocardia fusca]|uniref:DUF6119 family protein n=1 Tax=Nocardia fusca TaxID=941183 RepID=A0ABV3F514_9NOCA